MGGFKEYDQYDGLGLAELVKKKEISAAEICEEAIVRIERVNPALNAVITPMYDLAREAVQNNLPDGPFAGVPFLLKDLLGDFAGVPQTMGSKALKNFRNSDCWATRNLNYTGQPAIPGIRTIHRGDPAADLLLRLPEGWCRWPRQMMVPDLYVFRRHAVACLV
jgi:hypothetical protein